MGWLAVYTLLMCLMLIFAWGSRNEITQKVALLQLLSWVMCNVAYARFGSDMAALINPSIDAGICLCIAVIGFHARNWLALWVVILFMLEVAISVGVLGSIFAFGGKPGYLYFGALNAVFVGRMLVTGMVGFGQMDRADRNWGLGKRPLDHRVSG